MNERNDVQNPVIGLDYPDPDVIRVDDTYYMVSTTMHFMPGCEILRSYDLIHWEHATFVYHYLDHTPAQKLDGKQNIYGKGMWAASLRYYKGIFYICFVANDTHKTYLYRCESINGLWKKSTINGFYHDASLLFDDDDSVYIVYGNTDIHLLQLKSDLSGPLEGGINRVIVTEKDNLCLGYEGSHFYKINGRYYLFLIHSMKNKWRRVEACFSAESLLGEFTGGDVLNDDRGYCNQGVAQGGIVDTPDGKWYAILFQDHGAVGRIPILIPVIIDKNRVVFGKEGIIPSYFEMRNTQPAYQYLPLAGSDDFTVDENLPKDEKTVRYGCFGLSSIWQFNHEPDISLVENDAVQGWIAIKTDKLCENIMQAKNILTQKMFFPQCSAEVTIDGKDMNNGDFSGICAFQGCYGFVGLYKENDKYNIVMMNREAIDDSLQSHYNHYEGHIWEKIPCHNTKMQFCIKVDFRNMRDEAGFYYKQETKWKKIGPTHRLYFKMDHFTGCRFGLFIYSTEMTGGKTKFTHFVYNN